MKPEQRVTTSRSTMNLNTDSNDHELKQTEEGLGI